MRKEAPNGTYKTLPSLTLGTGKRSIKIPGYLLRSIITLKLLMCVFIVHSFNRIIGTTKVSAIIRVKSYGNVSVL